MNKKRRVTCTNPFQRSLGTTYSTSHIVRNPGVTIHKQHEHNTGGDLKQQFHGVQCCKIASFPSPRNKVISTKDLNLPSTFLPVLLMFKALKHFWFAHKVDSIQCHAC